MVEFFDHSLCFLACCILTHSRNNVKMLSKLSVFIVDLEGFSLMAKLIVPFVAAMDDYNDDGVKFVQDETPYYQFYTTIHHRPIASENDVEVGQEFFYTSYDRNRRSGVFRSMDEIFEARLMLTNANKGWFSLVDSEREFKYFMGTTEMLHMTKSKKIEYGMVEGIFGFTPKGRSISLKSLR